MTTPSSAILSISYDKLPGKEKPSLVQDDLSLKFSYEEDGHIQPPTMNRMMHPVSSALFYQYTTVKCLSSSIYTVCCDSMSLTGKMLNQRVSETTYRTSDDGFYRESKTKKVTLLQMEPSSPEAAFKSFVDFFEKSQTYSFFLDGNVTCYRLSAVDSPFFYPLNKTDKKYLDSDGRKRAHAKYLHKRLEEYWHEIIVEVDPVLHGRYFDLTPTKTPGAVKALGGQKLDKSSILHLMIRVLSGEESGHITSVFPSPPSVTTIEVKK